MKLRSKARRRMMDVVLQAAASVAALVGLLFLGWILYVVIAEGAAALHADFFLKLPSPPGSGGGGLANAILGTFYMTLLAVAIGVPTGILAGAYLSEYGRHTRFGLICRYTVNVMMGVPSIVVGLFIYTLLVVPLRHFSGYAGGLALALLMLPIVARTTEDMLRLVPDTLREAALALGAPRWRVTLGVVFREAKAGLTTGVLLAVARVSGETAPLLFTALNSPYWPTGLNQPTGNLTVTIFNYAMSPYPDWQAAAWGASLLITVGVLFATIAARVIFRKPHL